jgi:SAM-dependent methyltransferase
MPIPVYELYDPQADRSRLAVQSRVFGSYLRTHAPQFVGPTVRHILDLGCGEGQLGRTLLRVYPTARLVGLDRDAAAIAHAQHARPARRQQIEFRIGDMEQSLPSGPFDLIYASLSLAHLHRPAVLVPALYAALAPGGVLWIKDKGPDMAQAGTHPAYQQLVRWCFSALAALGGHLDIIAELRPLLARAGFREEHWEVEAYPLGGRSATGRAMLSNVLHLFAATQPVITRVHQVSAQEIAALSVTVAQAARQSAEPLGICPFSNLVVRRPGTE